MTYLHETFGNRNRIEKWFREVKVKTKRFYNNINAKTLKSIKELESAIVHNFISAGGEDLIPT
jgi:transposase-like protein